MNREDSDGGKLGLKAEHDGAGQSVPLAPTRKLLRLPFLAPSCDANSRFPALLVRAALLKAPIRFIVFEPG